MIRNVVSRDTCRCLSSLHLDIARIAASGRRRRSIRSAKSAIHLHSSPRRAFFRFRSVLFPAEQIVSIATTLRFLLPFFRAINFSSPPFPLLLPGEEDRVDGWDPGRSVHIPETDVGAQRSSIRLSPTSYKFNNVQ